MDKHIRVSTSGWMTHGMVLRRMPFVIVAIDVTVVSLRMSESEA